MPSFSITAAEANSMLAKLGSDLGSGAKIKIYAGTKPAVADTALGSPTLLATLVVSAAFFASIASNSSTNAVGTINTVTSATAVATGTATFFDVTTSADAVVGRGDISTSAANTGSLLLNTTSITTGSTVAITSGTVTAPVGN